MISWGLWRTHLLFPWLIFLDIGIFKKVPFIVFSSLLFLRGGGSGDRCHDLFVLINYTFEHTQSWVSLQFRFLLSCQTLSSKNLVSYFWALRAHSPPYSVLTIQLFRSRPRCVITRQCLHLPCTSFTSSPAVSLACLLHFTFNFTFPTVQRGSTGSAQGPFRDCTIPLGFLPIRDFVFIFGSALSYL